MIEQLNIKKLINVDGIPEEGQHRIDWIVNGECLVGAPNNTSNEGSLNRAPVAIQQNVVRVNDNAKLTVTKVNEIVTAVNDIKTTLGALDDGSIIEVVNQTIAKIEAVETNLGETSKVVQTTTTEVADCKDKIGVRPSTDDSNRTIYDDISFIKQEMGSYPGFNINGKPDGANTGSGLKYRVIQNTASLNNHGQRIDKLETDWRESDVGQLTDEVNKLRSELGETSQATQDNVYVRLKTNARNIANVSNEVIEIKKAILFESIPDIGTKVTDLTSKYETLNGDINQVNTGIRPRLVAVEKKLGTADTQGTIEYRLANSERELSEYKAIVGVSSSDGLRGLVTELSNQIGTDSNRHTISGRLKILESSNSRLEASVQDLEKMVGNGQSGLTAGVIRLSSDLYGKPESSDAFEKKGLVAVVKELEAAKHVLDVPDDSFHYIRKHGEWVQVAYAAGAFKNNDDIITPLDAQDTYKEISLAGMVAETTPRQMVKGDSDITVNDKGLFRVTFRVAIHSPHNATFVLAIFKNGVNVFEAKNGHYGTDELTSYSTSAFLNIDKDDKISIKIKGVSPEAIASPVQIKEFLLGISPV